MTAPAQPLLHQPVADVLNGLLQETAAQMPLFWPFVLMLFGAVFGSFFNCALHRLPRGESLSHPPSHCPHCQTRLGVPDLIPIFSYLILLGRCRQCRATIHPRYLFVELLTASLGLLAWLITGDTLWMFPLFAALLTAAFFILLKRKI